MAGATLVLDWTPTRADGNRPGWRGELRAGPAVGSPELSLLFSSSLPALSRYKPGLGSCAASQGALGCPGRLAARCDAEPGCQLLNLVFFTVVQVLGGRNREATYSSPASPRKLRARRPCPRARGTGTGGSGM